MLFKSKFKSEQQLLLAKFFSLVGDKAYDFALPFAIIALSPGNAFLAGMFICIRKIVFIYLMPKVGRAMDKVSCMKTVSYVLSVQMLMIFLIALLFWVLSNNPMASNIIQSPQLISILILTAVLDSMRQLCEISSEVTIKNFWIPKMFTGLKKSKVNASVKSLDLITEVIIPLVTALCFFYETRNSAFPIGFYYVSMINILTFIPEYILLLDLSNKHAVLTQNPLDNEGQIKKTEKIKNLSLVEKFKLYKKQPIFLAHIAQAFLGVTVLSSHSMFLRAYLVDFKGVSEKSIAVFQGGAALMGVLGIGGFIFFRKRMSLLKATQGAIVFQALMLTLSCIYFNVSYAYSPYVFIFLIALSRAGLYGYTLGLTEIEQDYLNEDSKGFVMGMSTSINQVGILFMLILATVVSKYENFYIPVTVSTLAISTSCVVYSIWKLNILNRKVVA